MTPVNLPYLNVRRHCKRGRLYVYAVYRRAGQVRPIVDEQGKRLLPDDPGFISAYQRIHAEFEHGVSGRPEDPRGSVAALVTAYLASAEFGQLDERTQADYRRYLDDLRQRARDRRGVSAPAATMPRAFVGKLRDELAGTAAKANRYVTVIRLLYAWGKMRGGFGISDNPADGWKKLKQAGPGWRAWTDAEWTAFTAAASPEMRLAAAIAYYTGLRRGDVLRLPWSAYDGTTIEAVTSKRGVPVCVRAHRDLRVVLDATPRASTIIATDHRGRPWREDTFSHRFTEQVAELKIGKGCTFHGLRKTAGRRLAEAGSTASEIQAVLGCSLQNAEHYTREASRRGLAGAAISKLERGENGR